MHSVVTRLRTLNVVTPFPKGRVLLRAWFRTIDQLSRVWGALFLLLMAILFATFFPVPEHPTWWDRFANLLIGAACAVAVALGLLFLFNLWRYRHSGHQDEHWISNAWDVGEGIVIALGYRHNPSLRTFREDDVMECRVLAPSGEVTIVPDREWAIGRTELRTRTHREWTEPGDYEVRWYRQHGRWFYEVTRAVHTL